MRSKRAIASGRSAPTASTDGGAAGGGWTRFAPAPTGYLHLGHVANAIWVWGLAARMGRRVLLRIEDHDRERSRGVYDAAILEDLAWLGFEADAGPLRQRDAPGPYEAALDRLRGAGLVYNCDCSRATFAAWSGAHGHPWSGPGCPGGCRRRSLADVRDLALRVSLGDGMEAWDDLLLGPREGAPSAFGDLAVRDRQGNWTYGFAVVVDDIRQDVDHVVRGEDLAEATPAQIRLGRLLGRSEPARFAHHALILKPNGSKLSKADGDTGVRDLRAAGLSPETVIGMAAAAVGLTPIGGRHRASDVADLIGSR